MISQTETQAGLERSKESASWDSETEMRTAESKV